MLFRLPLLLTFLTIMPTTDDDLPPGYWPEAKVAEILARTQTIRLAPDLSSLTTAEKDALDDLVAVGRILQRHYEAARHHQSLQSHDDLINRHRQLDFPERTRDLLTLYRLFQGPIATTLDNNREAFLPVDPQVPARNVYPPDLTRDEADAYLAAHPDQRATLLDERSMVRRATPLNLVNDLRTLSRSPFETLHAPLRAQLETLAGQPDSQTLYAVPYAVAFADDLLRVFELLTSAAAKLEPGDPEFARYLRNRARDLLSNDYESGDAAWVTGRFQKLNAQIGAYETYDDALFGVKAFPSVSLLVRDEAATAELRKNLGSLQAIEDALPYDHQKRVREDISVGIYDVVADFGQARGTNTATILPNDPLFSRRYGRTILLRRNIMENPTLFAGSLRVWKAATADQHHAELAPSGDFNRTLWHEVGHYLGVDRDRQGRTLDVALEDYADALEEMKSDLVSLFALHRFADEGVIDAARLRAVQAGGIRRTLQNNQPRKDQPYQTMQLAQFNYFLEHGLIFADPETAVLTIDYTRYTEVVTALLREVLTLQYQGDRGAAEAFFVRWNAWTPELHEKLATRIREAQGPRFTLVEYAALDE